MSSYCFNINNPNSVEYNITDLKNFVTKLYIGKKKNQFDKDDNPPFILVHTKSDKNICLVMTSKGKKNIERIELLNKSIKPNNLKWINDIYLSEPYEFNVDTVKWWIKDNIKQQDGDKWTNLTHPGPYFIDIMEPYNPLKASLIYEGKKVALTANEEKIASFYAKRKISENSGNVIELLTQDKVFNNNFWTDFKTYLTADHKLILKDFSKIRWDDIIKKIESSKTEIDKNEKIQKKTKAAEKKSEYGYAVLDGKKEKIANFTVEPQTMFIGRGDNPLRGRVKKIISPEDVTINIGVEDKVPKPLPGHKWGNIVHDKNAVWLSKWNDSITGGTKYIMFSAEGRFKGESDFAKYEKARKLEKHINTVREKYMGDATSKNIIKKQLGTVLYLIDHFGVRVGNEKSDDEADTVGASTLRVDHVNLDTQDHVIFDFLGKDSIRFYKDLEVPNLIYENFKKLIAGKKKTDQVFDSISSTSINTYLKEFDKSFSAKAFRTRLASKIMFDALKTVKIPKNSTKAQIKVLFNKANAQVADVLNHTRNVSKKNQDDVKKYEEELKDLKKELKNKKKEKKSTESLEKRIQGLNTKIEAKTDVMTVAINTSLTNYIDPRLVVSWSKSQSVDLTAIYTSTLFTKFKWAMEMTDSDWNWETTPMIGNSLLDSIEEGSAVSISIDDKPPKKSTRRRSVKINKPTTLPIRPRDDEDTQRNPIKIGDYYEKQESLGCGRHALNNLFGRHIFIKNGPKLTDVSYNNLGSSDRDIPLQSICLYLAEKEYLKNGSENMCPVNENYESIVLQAGLGVLGYETENPDVPNGQDWKDWKKIKDTDDTNVIGYIVNFGGGHWVTFRKLDNGRYTYLDSIGNNPIGKTDTLNNIKNMLKNSIHNNGVLQVKFTGKFIDVIAKSHQPDTLADKALYKTGDIALYKPNNEEESQYVVIEPIRHDIKLIGYWVVKESDIDIQSLKENENYYISNSSKLLKNDANKNIPQILKNKSGERNWYFATVDKIQNKPNKTNKPNKPNKPVEKVGKVEDYKLILKICENPDKSKKGFSQISKEAMDWIYPFSKYAIEKNINEKVNQYIVKFYEAAYF